MGRILFTLLAGLVVLALAGCGASSGSGSAGGSAGSSSGEDTQPEQQPGTSGPSEQSGNPALGSADAPVVMIEWGDFQ